MTRVDLNIDLGELPDEPDELYALATIVNIACGGHAGDAASMARAIENARSTIAAHPSYPDKKGFGRVTMALPREALEASLSEQCRALADLARRAGRRVVTVKPHGALYHDANGDPALARLVIEAAATGLDVQASQLTLVGPPRGALADEARARGLRHAREGFADRRYEANGELVSRKAPGAVIEDPAVAAAQALDLAASGSVDTLCVHGDNPNAVLVARAVREALQRAGLSWVSP